MFHHLRDLLIDHRVSSVRALFVNTAIRSTAISLFGIFEPIYIYQLTRTVPPVLIYYVIIRLGSILFAPAVGEVVARLGFRRSVLVSNLTLSLHLLFLMFGRNDLNLVFLAALFGVPAVLFYWYPLHILMIDDGRPQNLGREISLLEIVSKIFHVLPPFIGGLLIVFGGFNLLYSFSILLVLLSSGPLFFMPPHRHPKRLEYLKFLRAFTLPKLSFFLHGFEDFFLVALWPIFVFRLLDSFETVGFLTSVTLFVTSIALMTVGYLTDRGQSRAFYRLGTLGSAFVFPWRAFLSTPLSVLFLDSFHGLIRVFQAVSFSYLTYRNSPPGYEYEYVVFREMLLDAGRVSAAFCAAFWLYPDFSWPVVFLLPAVANLLIFSFSKEFRSSS